MGRRVFYVCSRNKKLKKELDKNEREKVLDKERCFKSVQ